MPLPFKYESKDEIPEPLREYYTEKDGEYLLDTDVSYSEDFRRLKSNRDNIIAEKKREKEKLRQLQEAKEQEHLTTLEKDKKYEEALDLMRKKYTADTANADAHTAHLRNQLETAMKATAVSNLAAKLAGENAALLAPHIESRLVVKEVDGVEQLFVADVTGAPSAMTVEQLGEEFANNSIYAPILSGRQSSGGNSSDQRGQPGEVNEWEQCFKPESINLTQQMRLMKVDPAMYKKLKEKYKQDPNQLRVIR